MRIEAVEALVDGVATEALEAVVNDVATEAVVNGVATEAVVDDLVTEEIVVTETVVDGAGGPVAMEALVIITEERVDKTVVEKATESKDGKTGGKGKAKKEWKIAGGKGRAKKKKGKITEERLDETVVEKATMESKDGKTRRKGTDGVDQLILRYTALTKDDLSDLKTSIWGLSREQHEQCETARIEVLGGRFNVLGDVAI